MIVANPIAVVVSAPGTNRGRDIGFALGQAGSTTKQISLNELLQYPDTLQKCQILVFAGGFSYADALGAGTVAGFELRSIEEPIRDFVARGLPVLGVCNGFQTLVRAKLLPGSLVQNQSGGFVCQWVKLAAQPSNNCVWLNNVGEIECPVAHGEGRYWAPPNIVSTHAVLRYADGTNPNGSVNDVAGVTDETGLILGMMPHPENHVLNRQHPHFARGTSKGLARSLFESGVNHVRGRQ